MSAASEPDTRYRAFLSYSHRDERFASRFHRDLERWRAGRAIAGRQTRRGIVPRDLRPIFRDRDDFAGGSTLADATARALEESDNLIVLCTPDAARSAYVNDEIRRFKALGRGDRIIPVIVDGEPGDPEQECFPEALVHAVDDEGRLTSEREEPLAADARDQGDGPRRALAKVIAGMLDLPFDEIVRRAELAQRRRNRLIAAAAMVMAVLAVLAGGFGWLAENRREVAERNYIAAQSAADQLLVGVGVELLQIEGVPLATSKRLIDRAGGIYDELIRSLPDSEELRFRKASALLAFGQAYANKGGIDAAREELVEAERLLLEIGAAENPGLAPMLAQARLGLGRILIRTDRPEEGRERLVLALEALTGSNGETVPETGQVYPAVEAMMALAEADPVDAGRWHDRAEALIGNALRAEPDQPRLIGARAILLNQRANHAADRGEVQEALLLNGRALADMESFAGGEPDMLLAQGGLVAILEARIDLLRRSGDDDAANEAGARLKAVTDDVQSTGVRNQVTDMIVSAADIRDALARMEGGKLAEPLTVLLPALRQLEQARAADPDNTMLAQSVIVVLTELTRVLNDAGLHADAVSLAERLVALSRTALADEADADAARYRLASALGALADAQEGMGEMGSALESQNERLTLAEQLAASDPGRRRMVALVLDGMALLHWRMSDRDTALPLIERRVAILDDLLAEMPGDTGLMAERNWSLLNIGELLAIRGEVAGAAEALQRFHAAATRAHDLAPEDRWLATDRAWSEARLAQLGDAPACRWPRVRDILLQADRSEPLHDQQENLLIAASVEVLRGRVCPDPSSP